MRGNILSHGALLFVFPNALSDLPGETQGAHARHSVDICMLKNNRRGLRGFICCYILICSVLQDWRYVGFVESWEHAFLP
jgi:hypothetical protein